MKTRVLIIEPSEVIAEGLAAVLAEQTRFKVLPSLRSLEGLDERLVTGKPDVVVINPTIVARPAEVIDTAATPIVALVYQYVEPSLLKQYHEVIDIRDSRGVIAETLVRATQNHSEAGGMSVSGSYELSRRETDVLVQVARGLTNKEIADTLNVSVHTVISHRKNIVHKTGIKSVAGLTVYAILNNLIDESVL